jgi:hypothetical protein
MKLLHYSFLILLIVGHLQPGFAQKSDKPVKQPWILYNRLYLSDSTGVSIADNAYKKFGLAFINESGNVEKEIPFPGRISGIARLNDHVVAFYTLETGRDPLKTIHAVLVDIPTKTILLDKPVYENTSDKQIVIYVPKDSRENFKFLLIRESGLTGKMPKELNWKDQKAFVTSTALKMVLITDKLEAAVKSLSGVTLGGTFITTRTNKQGEAFVVSQSNDQLICEKFGPDGQLIKKLASPLEFSKDMPYDHQEASAIDTTTGNTLTTSIRCRTNKDKFTLTTVSFDFINTKAWSTGTQLLDKDYSRGLKAAPGFEKIANSKNTEDLTPIGVIPMDNKLIVWKDFKGDYDALDPRSVTPTRYTNGGSVISVYDNKLTLLHNIFLDKLYESFTDVGRDLSFHIQGDKLIALGNEIIHAAAYGDFFYTLDLNKFTVEKQKADWGNISTSAPIDPSNVFWFRNKIVLSHWSGNISSSDSFSYLQSIDYPDPAANTPTKK